MTVNLFPPGVTDESPEIGEEIDFICTEIHEACKGFGTYVIGRRRACVRACCCFAIDAPSTTVNERTMATRTACRLCAVRLCFCATTSYVACLLDAGHDKPQPKKDFAQVAILRTNTLLILPFPSPPHDDTVCPFTTITMLAMRHAPGTDEKRLLRVMGQQTPEQRCKVHIAYKKKYGKELKDVMKAECGKKAFGQALQYLALAPDMAECEMLHNACKG